MQGAIGNLEKSRRLLCLNIWFACAVRCDIHRACYINKSCDEHTWIKKIERSCQLPGLDLRFQTLERHYDIWAKKLLDFMFPWIFLSPEVSNCKGNKGYALNFCFEQDVELIRFVFTQRVCLRFQTVEHFDIWAQTKILATDHHSLLLTTMFTLYDEALCLSIQNCFSQIDFTQKERYRKIQKLFCKSQISPPTPCNVLVKREHVDRHQIFVKPYKFKQERKNWF